MLKAFELRSKSNFAECCAANLTVTATCFAMRYMDIAPLLSAVSCDDYVQPFVMIVSYVTRRVLCSLLPYHDCTIHHQVLFSVKKTNSIMYLYHMQTKC